MSEDIFDRFKNNLLAIDPIYFIEKYLTLEGKPFRLTNNGYRPFADIYRYIAIKALERTSKPIVIIKGRQVGATTMCSALEMYFMGCGLFGNGSKPPIRIIHAFPQLDIAYAYSKTKLNPMVSGSMATETAKKGQKPKSYMQSLLDPTSPTNDSLNFKQFAGGNHIWIESTGDTGDRLRGRSADIIFWDECFPYDTCIETSDGKIEIGDLVERFHNKQQFVVKSFNKENKSFEYKKVINAWNKGERDLVEVKLGRKKVRCTPNHRFLTNQGYVYAGKLQPGDLVLTAIGTKQYLRALNEDQLQVVVGSYLGDGGIRNHASGRYRLSVTHGESQKEYCQWMASLFGTEAKFIAENGEWKKPAWKFNSKSFALPNFIGKKDNCPQWIIDQLDVKSLAIWFMDDGCVLKNKHGEPSSGAIYTNSFDLDSQYRLMDKLRSFGIDSVLRKNKIYNYIGLNQEAYHKLSAMIAPYVHPQLNYKLRIQDRNIPKYNWNNEYPEHGYEIVDSVTDLNKKELVYDIEVEDNHNFIVTSSKGNKGLGGLVVSNCQDYRGQAIGTVSKLLTKSNYGRLGEGVQVFFGTPKQRGSEFYEMWNKSSQQYYHLHCESCDKYFPLYTPGTDDWEKTWISGYTVECPHCQHQQNKVTAAEKGKWVATRDPDECDYIGFHMSQLFIPDFSKEKIIGEKPENSVTNSERVYQNEVLGEFFSGETGIITPDQIRDLCGDVGRKFRAHISPSESPGVFVGIDIGQKADLEQLVDSKKSKTQGQSFSVAVVLNLVGPNLLQIEYVRKFKQNDYASKKEFIEHLMRMYSANVTVCDIGYANDFCQIMHTEHGERFIASNALPQVNGNMRYVKDVFPKVIQFSKDHCIGELYEQMKKGHIRFPMGDYEKLSWFIQHCTSMEIKPTITRSGDVTPHYVKGAQPNDGFMALLNAYLGYKWYQTKGFTINNPMLFHDPFSKEKPRNNIPALLGVMPRMR